MEPGSSSLEATRTNLDLLARVLADRLGAPLAVVFRPGGRPGEVEVAGGFAAGPAAAVLRERVLFAPVAGALHAEVLDGGAVVVADADAQRSARHLGVPAALDHAIAEPLTKVAVAPVPVRGGPGGTLLVAWSEPLPAVWEQGEDLATDLARSGRRFGAVLAGQVVDEPLPLPMVGSPSPAATGTAPQRGPDDGENGPASAAGAPWLPTLAERVGMVVGLAAPILVIGLSSAADDPARFRPLAALLAIVVALAATAGRRAATVGATSAVLSGWWGLLPRADSFVLEEFADVVALLTYAVACGGVVWLISRLEEVRQREADERRLLDVLLDEAPIGIGLLDGSLRFRRANRRLAEIHRMAPGAHVGRTPGEVSPLEGEIYEPILGEAAASGRRRLHHDLALEVPELGTEQHLRISAYPLVGGDGRPMGVGTTVDDITSEVLRRRRSDLLLALSLELAGASQTSEAEVVAARLVAEALRARTVVAHAAGDVRRITTTSGYSPQGADAWASLHVTSGDGSALDRCIRTGEVVLDRIGPEEGDEGAATGASPEARLRRELGDLSFVWQPVRLPGSSEVVGAFSVAWPYPRIVTEESQILLQTVSAVAALAIGRIELAEERAQDRFRTALDAMLDQVAIGRAIRDEAGAIVDFDLEFLNVASLDGAGRGAEELLGRRVCEVYPGWRESGLFARFAEVVETGRPWVVEAMRYEDATPEGEPIVGYWNIQVVRVGDGYIAATRDVTDVVEAEAQAREAERLAERERLTLDLLQRAALPEVLPDAPGLELGAHYRAAEQRHRIGGDWYDAFPLGDGRTALVIADVSGHGAESASFMVQARNIVRAVAAEEDQPGEVIRRANAIIECLEPEGRPFVTACIAIVDRPAGRLRLASAGHPPPLLVRSDGARYLDVSPGPPLGVFPDATWSTTEVDLEPGDVVVGFTDGLVEVRGEIIDDGLERFRSGVVHLAAAAPDAPSLADDIARAVVDPGDDLAVMVLWVR